MKTNTIIPRLRFPEFREDEGWETKSLSLLSKIVRGGSPRPIDSYMTNDVNGLNWLKIGDVDKEAKYIINTNEKVIKKALSKTRVVKPNDLIMSNSMSFGRPFILQIEACIHDGWIAITNLKELIDRDFLYYFILSENSQKYFLANAAGSGVKNLNIKIIDSLPVTYPFVPEQQKIADCLASLDNLLSAESQQLDSLQTYKAGLLQQLFPAEGETVPKIRFDGFEGDWKETTLNSICEFVRGPFGGTLKKDIFVKSGYAVYEQSHAIHSDFNSFRYFIDEEKFDELKRFKVKADDLIMSCSGTMGKFSRIPAKAKEGVINQALLKLTVKNNYDISFIKIALEMPLNQNKLLSQSAGGAVKNVVGVKLIKQITIAVPSVKEQTKIAKVISSLDNLIESQALKIEMLKQHKQGLMQQLFPL